MINSRELHLPEKEEMEVDDDFVSGYEGVIKRIVADSVKDVGDFTIDFDDLYQEGMIALIHASRKYKNTGQATFMTYAYTAIKNRVKRAATNYTKVYSAEYSYSEDPKKYEGAFSTEEKPDYSPIVKEFIKRLNYDDQRILNLYLQGKSYAEIAAITNVTVKKVDNRLCQIKKKLSEYYQSIK